MLQRFVPPPPSGPPPPPSLGDSPSRLDLQRWAAAAGERDAQRRLADETIERLQRIRLDAEVSAPPRLPPTEWAGLEERPQQQQPAQLQPSRALLPSASSAALLRPPADPRWTPLPLRRPALPDAQPTDASAQDSRPDAEFKRPEAAAAAAAAAPAQSQQPTQSQQSHRGPTVPAAHDPLLRPHPDAEFKSSATESELERRQGEQPEAKRTKLTHPHPAAAQPFSSAAAQPPPPEVTAVRLQEHKEEEPLTRGQSEWTIAHG